ncbi:NAD-dependent epimerase/dehydratase family protein [Candidatus Venteria ishoeyi]|uniref:NAD-dependent epimerase/dehydratase family protein n=1 Tax=Candidatus Venteria ishoeyi TaxID=1899563 RepID=UPI0025A634B2|nr:NAD-dependent epimerase/dehydratase family protein [Candidatus Venteria ishoeyi]MDM8546563.1 NAD-dependent epimerase/dehydratase family protein [Candidatus Venteria ishoeyi]
MSEPNGILVLGGSGFVGQCLLPHLPPPVYVISRQKLSNLPVGAQAFQVGLDDVPTLKKILPKCRWLIHLASDSTPGVSAGKPLFEAEHNLVPNLCLFELLQDYPHVKLLYLSSGGAVYGNPGDAAVSECTPLHPLSYYAAGKIALEAFITALVQQSPRPAVILRPSNFYGPGQAYRPGFGVIPTVLQYQQQGKPLHIWGDGENVRDYLFIEDFIQLCLLLLRQNELETGAKIYNVGAGYGCSLNQLCGLLEQVTGQRVLREYHPARAVDVQHIVLDTARIQSACGWQAQTALTQGLEKTWAWWHKNRRES